ncbi:MAG: type II toxin-antitoxin system HicA family toxin [Ketobacter sp.]|nr:type II toxin-antitoxin system HicA family toxin [Ketobacter sp.]
MSGQYPPLECRDVKKILQNLGFTPRPRKGTSHEQWVRDDDERRYKVTVDCPKAPFSQKLIGYMARQAGVSKREFYAVLNK